MSGNGQTETRSSRFPGSGPIHAIKPLKDPSQILLTNADAGISDIQSKTTADRTSRDCNAPSGAIVMNGVIQKVGKGARQSRTVAQNLLRWAFQFDANTVLIQPTLPGLNLLLDEVAHVDRLFFNRRLAFQSSQRQQVIHKRLEQAAVPFDRFQKFPVQLGILWR